MENIRDWVKDFVKVFNDGPTTQVDPKIVKRVSLLSETDNLLIMREILENILNDCVRYSLCSDFVVKSLDVVLKTIKTEINYEKIG